MAVKAQIKKESKPQINNLTLYTLGRWKKKEKTEPKTSRGNEMKE